MSICREEPGLIVLLSHRGKLRKCGGVSKVIVSGEREDQAIQSVDLNVDWSK